MRSYSVFIRRNTINLFWSSNISSMGCCNVAYPSQNESVTEILRISFIHTIHCKCEIFFIFYTEYGSITAVLSAKWQNKLGKLIINYGRIILHELSVRYGRDIFCIATITHFILVSLSRLSRGSIEICGIILCWETDRCICGQFTLCDCKHIYLMCPHYEITRTASLICLIKCVHLSFTV